jgi:hypothetical protein
VESVKFKILWDTTPCTFIERHYNASEEPISLIITVEEIFYPEEKGESSSEIFAFNYKTTWRHTSEKCNYFL